MFAEDNIVQFGESGWKARTSTMERSRTIDRKATPDRKGGTLDRKGGTLDRKGGTLDRKGSHVNQDFIDEDYDLDFTDDQKMMFES